MTKFLLSSTDAVQRVVLELQGSDKSRYSFSSFVDLAESPNLDVDVQTVLFYVVQLGCLVE